MNYTYKYNVGDTVTVRPDLKEQTYRSSTNSDITNSAVSDMLEFAGKTLTVSDCIRGQYRVKEAAYLWTDEMFLDKPLHSFKPGDVVIPRKDLVAGQTYGNITLFDGMLKELQSAPTHRVRYVSEDYLTLESSMANFHYSPEMFEVPSTENLTYDKEYPFSLPKGNYAKFEIPRKKKTPRQIVAPGTALLKYQQSQLQLLEKELKRQEQVYNIEDIIHGFVKDRNCVTAATKHIGYDLTIMMDIVAFFDSVTPAHTQINDPSFYTLEGYCGQGFATSPLLANIGIVPILAALKEYLEDAFKDRYAFTVYADDIQISINSDNFIEETDEIIENVKAVFECYGFKIHPHKTRIRHAKFGWRRILGVNVGDKEVRATRKTMRKIKAARHQNNGPSLGGLVTWAKCLPPKALRPQPSSQRADISLTDLAKAYAEQRLTAEETIGVYSSAHTPKTIAFDSLSRFDEDYLKQYTLQTYDDYPCDA